MSHLLEDVGVKVEVTEGADEELEVEAVGEVAGLAQRVHCQVLYRGGGGIMSLVGG